MTPARFNVYEIEEFTPFYDYGFRYVVSRMSPNGGRDHGYSPIGPFAYIEQAEGVSDALNIVASRGLKSYTASLDRLLGLADDDEEDEWGEYDTVGLGPAPAAQAALSLRETFNARRPFLGSIPDGVADSYLKGERLIIGETPLDPRD